MVTTFIRMTFSWYVMLLLSHQVTLYCENGGGEEPLGTINS